MFNSCISSASESCRKGAIQMYYYYHHNYYNYNYYNYYLCAILKRNGSLTTALALQFGFDTWTIPSPCSTIKTQQPSFCTTSITAYLPTLPVFPGVSKFFMKSPGLPVRAPNLPGTTYMALFTFRIH